MISLCSHTGPSLFLYQDRLSTGLLVAVNIVVILSITRKAKRQKGQCFFYLLLFSFPCIEVKINFKLTQKILNNIFGKVCPASSL